MILTLEFVLSCVLLPIFCIIGIISNSLLLYILFHSRFRVRAYRFLKFSAVADLGLNLLTILYPVLDKLVQYTNPDVLNPSTTSSIFTSFGWILFTSRVHFALKYIFSRFSVLSIMLLAIDRYLVLQRTNLYIKWRNSKLFKLSPYIAMIVVIALSIPMRRWYEVKSVVHYDVNNSSIKFYSCDRVGINTWPLTFKLYSFVREFLLSQVPTFVLLVLTYRVISSVHSLSKIAEEKENPHSTTKTNKKVIHGIKSLICKTTHTLVGSVNTITPGPENYTGRWNYFEGKINIGILRIPLVLEEEYWLTILLVASTCLHIIGIIPMSILNLVFTIRLDDPFQGNWFYTLVNLANFLEYSKSCFDSLVYMTICPKIKIPFILCRASNHGGPSFAHYQLNYVTGRPKSKIQDVPSPRHQDH